MLLPTLLQLLLFADATTATAAITTDAIAAGGQAGVSRPIINTDRSVGARVAGAIAKQWGNIGFQNAGT
jgi:glutamate synthase domain-containing protein 3